MVSGYPCVSMDSMGNCGMTDNGLYEEDEYPNGADEQGICMDCRSLDDCEEYEESDEDF